MAVLEKTLYTAHATATGGRDGRALTSDGALDVKLATPRELGGTGGPGTNPEQLFAAGYAACFIGAMRFVAGQKQIKFAGDPSIDAAVSIGPISGGFGIQVAMKIKIPGLSQREAESLVQAAHGVCPYSNATRNNIQVSLSVVPA